MAVKNNAIIKAFLQLLQQICVILSILPIMGVILSLNPGVKWNEYKEDLTDWGMKTQYYHTLSSSEDPAKYLKGWNNAAYLEVLKPKSDDSENWKIPVKNDLYKALGLTCGGLFLLIVSQIVHIVTKEKLFTIILMIVFSALGGTGGYYMENARSRFIDGLPQAISKTAKNYYHPDKNEELLGSILVHYTAIVLLLGCGINLLTMGLFIKFGEGEWIWQRKNQTEVLSLQTKTEATP